MKRPLDIAKVAARIITTMREKRQALDETNVPVTIIAMPIEQQ